MTAGAIAVLEAAIDALAAESIAVALGTDLQQLQQLRARLDAQISRRVRAFDIGGS